jgi:integrase
MARRRFQNGCLFLRGRKNRSVWVAQYRVDEVDHEGKVRRILRKEVLGSTQELKTRRLAQRELAERLERINSFSYRPGRTATLAQFLETYRRNILTLRKPSSAKAAESHLRVYLIPRLGKLKLEELEQQTIQQLVSALARRVARHTLLNVLGTLGGILKSARAYGYTCGNYLRDALVLPAPSITKQPRFFSAGEVARILSAAIEEPYHTMFSIAALTGFRAGEICGLSVDSVDMERKTITVTQSAWYGQLQAPKSKSAVRTVPIPGILCDILRAYLREWKPNPSRLLFATRTGKPHSANKVVQRKLWPILNSLKIPRAGFHAFRHAASTLLIDLGASPATVQAQLGHSDPRITLSAYSHTVDKSQREAVERLAQILIPKDAKTLETASSGMWIQ